MSSLPADAHTRLSATSHQWAVENSLHCALDGIFRKDHSHIRLVHTAHNMVILHQVALNIIKKDPSKGGVCTKRYQAALDTAFSNNGLTEFDATFFFRE